VSYTARSASTPRWLPSRPTYDGNGNLTGAVTVTHGYGYDAENRLVSASGAILRWYAYGQGASLWRYCFRYRSTPFTTTSRAPSQ
jgi:hypothetical protein